jgi:hypothetical protein
MDMAAERAQLGFVLVAPSFRIVGLKDTLRLSERQEFGRTFSFDLDTRVHLRVSGGVLSSQNRFMPLLSIRLTTRLTIHVYDGTGFCIVLLSLGLVHGGFVGLL